MKNKRYEKLCTVTAYIFVTVLVLSLVNTVFVRAAGEITINETSLVLTDGSNSMTGNLNMSQNELLFGVIHKSSSSPSSAVEGQLYYDTDDYLLYVYNGTGWTTVGNGTSIINNYVETISKNGESQLTGNVTFSAGENVTLTQAGNDIEISASGGGLTTVNIDNINATGTPSDSTYLRGDGSWVTPDSVGGAGGIAAPDIVVYKNVTTFYAVADGATLEYGATLVTVINDALDSYTNGCWMHIKNMSETLTGPIIIQYPAVRLTGSGIGSIYGSDQGTTLTAASGQNLIEITPAGYSGYEFAMPKIQFIKFIGANSGGGHGITSEDITDDDYYGMGLLVEYCQFDDFGTANKYALNIKNCEMVKILHNHMDIGSGTNTNALIRIYSTNYSSGNHLIQHNFFTLAPNYNQNAVLIQAGLSGGSGEKGVWGVKSVDNTYYRDSGTGLGGLQFDAVSDLVQVCYSTRDRFERCHILVNSTGTFPDYCQDITIRDASFQYQSGASGDQFLIDITANSIAVKVFNMKAYASDTDCVGIRNRISSSAHPLVIDHIEFDGTFNATVVDTSGYESQTYGWISGWTP